MIPLSFIKTAFTKGRAQGFTLVELIATIVLVGIIGTFTTFFLYTGFKGYLRAKDTAEGALKAQIALDRISLELRDINAINAFIATPDPNPSIDYTNTILPGDRRIRYDSANDEILLRVGGVGGDENLLLDEVKSFTMTALYADLNYYGSGGNEVQAINVDFTVGEIGRPFSARIFPRNMVPQPP
jgi:prepilin-type N-terminal cleavage/methylation domain-containing protein